MILSTRPAGSRPRDTAAWEIRHEHTDDTEPARLDGNALGGPVAELFTTDLTAAVVTCMHCGRVAPLATYHVYADAPGARRPLSRLHRRRVALRVGHARPTVRDDWRATVDDDDATRQRAVASATRCQFLVLAHFS